MKVSELLAIMERLDHERRELIEMRRAVGAWPWRRELMQASDGKGLSEWMTLAMALVTFEGYEIGGPNRERTADRHSVPGGRET